MWIAFTRGENGVLVVEMNFLTGLDGRAAALNLLFYRYDEVEVGLRYS